METDKVIKLTVVHRNNQNDIEKANYFFDELEEILSIYRDIGDEWIELDHCLMRIREARMHWDCFTMEDKPLASPESDSPD